MLISVWSKIVSSILIVLIGATASVLFIVNQGVRLQQEVDQYPATSTSIYLYGVSEDRADSVLSVLGRFADGDGRAVVRVDHQTSNVDGGLSALRIGVIANPRTPPSALDLRFLGTSLVDTPTISKLLTSKPTKSVGLDANARDVIATIPELAFAPRLSVVNLSHMIDTSGTINGTYRVVGADATQVNELLTSLADLTGQTPKSMLAPLHGQETDSGLIPSILLGCLIAASILLLLLLVFEALRSFPVLGVHLLLGKSNWGFAVKMFRSALLTAVATAVLSFLLTIVLAHGYQLNGALMAAAWSCAVAGTVPVLVCIAIAICVITSTKPVNAILGRYSKKILLWTLSGLYLAAVAGFAFMLVYIDGPIKEVGKLANVSHTWSTVENQEILYQLSPGNDGASMSGQSTQLAKDFYDWYSSIADKPGVSLTNTVHYDRSTLDQWSGIYASVPEQPFWYIAASPSSLAEQGFDVSPEILARAEQGERVFLLPDTWTGTATTAMQEWLTEDSHPKYEPSIRTEYFNEEKVVFEDYSPKTPLFSWTTDTSLPPTVTDPVILISTPANMIPFESESLYAVGLDNSYIKLSTAAAHEYTSSQYLAEYHLDDNKVEFLPVSQFIAGLTKTIQATLQLFGGVIVFLFLLISVALIALLRLFSNTYRESLVVKRMLGYALMQLFAPAILVIGVTGAIAVIVAILLQSTSAILGSIILLAIQLALVTFLIRRYSRLQLSSALKE
ncbi:hypothetical protein PU630_16735 [Microbacterium horticulturae]|uniref:Uncharacterized protein n=1 Tax=Microbacterium horticulturae TaxID=3028316 RepID=A0ABY8C0V0_9MICO|nr:hypothetical protein [Microbacterium sp. KACC 23027]WEG08865.1 hypothetical protein PU630_16735 [Microbacterium sp. KACC 23027]